jgi:isoquinoline 1-oxidoreductase beta subunit
MPIEWDVPPENAARNTANMRATLIAALDKPGSVRANVGDVDRALASGARIIEATYSTPYLPRARMEPGNATVLVTDDRVDIWIGDQSPQETRNSASQITGIPEKNVHLHMCHLGGGFGRNGNGPQAEQAIYIANKNRGTPIHLLWTREEDFIGTTYRAMSVARLARRRSMPMAGRSPSKCGPPWTRRPLVPSPPSTKPRVTTCPTTASRPTPRLSTFPWARGAALASRRTISIVRASSMSLPTRPARILPLSPRADRAHRPSLQRRHAQGAGYGGADVGLGHATAARHGAHHRLEERGAESGGHATLSAQVNTISISRQGEVRVLRVDIAHEEGFALVNPLTVRKQIEGMVTWFYNDVMYQECNVETGRIVENNFDRFPLSRMKENPPEINIAFFKTEHWLRGMGHDRSTTLQSGIADAVFQITGKRYRDLPCATTT